MTCSGLSHRVCRRGINKRLSATLAVPAILLAMLLTSTQALAQADAERVYFEQLRQRLINDGVSPSVVYAYFDDPRFQIIHELLRINIRQPSGTAGYQRFMGDASVRSARSFLDENRETIEQALGDNPVEPEVVVAILKVESEFGSDPGTYRLLNVFATLTILDSDQLEEIHPSYWDRVLEGYPSSEHAWARQRARERMQRKARWAYRELTSLLMMAEAGTLDPLEARGSWAGAFGMPQFLPSSTQAYGVDGDGDGHIDLYSLRDAAASVGNYLRLHGYSRDDTERRRRAVWHYNHSEEYVTCILTLADRVAESRR